MCVNIYIYLYTQSFRGREILTHIYIYTCIPWISSDIEVPYFPHGSSERPSEKLFEPVQHLPNTVSEGVWGCGVRSVSHNFNGCPVFTIWICLKIGSPIPSVDFGPHVPSMATGDLGDITSNCHSFTDLDNYRFGLRFRLDLVWESKVRNSTLIFPQIEQDPFQHKCQSSSIYHNTKQQLHLQLGSTFLHQHS